MSTLKNSFLLLSLLILGNSYGQSSLLWRITGDDIDTSYVFGTIHINDSRVKAFDDSFYAKVNSCEVLTGEIIMDSVDMGAMMANMSKMMLPPGMTLKSLYEEESQYLEVSHAIDSILGFMGAGLKMMKPFYAAGALGADGFQSEQSTGAALDEFLQNYAKKNGMALNQLESVQAQMAVVDKISLNEQAEMLYETVSDLGVNDSTEGTEEFLAIYLSQDLDSLSKYFTYLDGDSDFMTHLIENRNVGMADRIMQLSKDSRVFHTFGAGHLGGETGILELLRGKGLKVEPVTYSYNY